MLSKPQFSAWSARYCGLPGQAEPPPGAGVLPVVVLNQLQSKAPHWAARLISAHLTLV